MNRLRKICTSVFVIAAVTNAFCFEKTATETLLMSYLQNDSELKKNAIEIQKAQLDIDSLNLEKGFALSLSSGDITLSSNKDGFGITVKPSVKAQFNDDNNMTVSVSSTIDLREKSQSAKDNKISFSMDIINTNELQNRITALEKQRNLILALRKIQTLAVTAEKNFYNELRNILSSASSIISLQNTYYSNQIDFEKIKAQGYSTASSTYRLAQMKVISNEHEIESKRRSFINSYVSFYKDCGIDAVIEDNVQIDDLIPEDIIEPQLLNIESFNPELYSETESALWTKKINTMKRQCDEDFTLSADAGINVFNSSNNKITLDTGVNASYKGMTFSAGIELPVTFDEIPTVTFSASYVPKYKEKKEISENQNRLSEQLEDLQIQNAAEKFATEKSELEKKLEDLEWTIKSNDESFEMYSGLEKDLKSWYEKGLISRSEYESAKTSAQGYRMNKIINIVDLVLYNNYIKSLFVEEMQVE